MKLGYEGAGGKDDIRAKPSAFTDLLYISPRHHREQRDISMYGLPTVLLMGHDIYPHSDAKNPPFLFDVLRKNERPVDRYPPRYEGHAVEDMII